MRQATEFINALPTDRHPRSAIALGVLLEHRYQDLELCIDLLVEDDSIATVLDAIREHVGGQWAFVESWVVDSDSLVKVGGESGLSSLNRVLCSNNLPKH